MWTQMAIMSHCRETQNCANFNTKGLLPFLGMASNER